MMGLYFGKSIMLKEVYKKDIRMSLGATKRLVVSLHDVHPGSLPRIKEQLAWCRRLGVERVTLFAVPNFHGQAELEPSGSCAHFLREAEKAGHEVALHGFYHSSNFAVTGVAAHKMQGWCEGVYTAGEAEFYRLDEQTASGLINRGLEALHACDLRPRGFVAPAWLLSAGAERAVWAAGLEWTCLVNDVRTARGVLLRSRSLCWSVRSAWRRVASLVWNELLFQIMNKNSVLRISIHPPDFSFRMINEQISRLIENALAAGFVASCYGGLVTDHRVAGF